MVGVVGAALTIFLIVTQEFALEFESGLSSRDFAVALIVAAALAIAGPVVGWLSRRGADKLGEAANNLSKAAAANEWDQEKGRTGS